MKRFLFLLLCVLSISSFAVAQTTVTGTVTDKDGDPLIGANVLVKGTSVGTITDFDGIYEIDVPEGSDVIRYSYTGFETKEISIDGQNTIDVSLTAGQLLDEVIVTALGIRKEKKALGYAAQAISDKM